MFVCVARLSLDIPASGSLKAKRQVLRRVTDRVKARFNVSVAEVEDNDLWQRATIALALVSNERRHAQEQIDKIIQFVDDMYVAPLVARNTEILSFGEDLFPGAGAHDFAMPIPKAERSLAEAEGMGAWEKRHEAPVAAAKPQAAKGEAKKLSLDEARERARRLRNLREWEKK